MIWSGPARMTLYHTLSRTFIDSLMATIHALDPGADPAAVIRAKTYDIVTDLAFAARLAFDIANARKANRTLRYDAAACPMLAFLEAGGDPARNHRFRASGITRSTPASRPEPARRPGVAVPSCWRGWPAVNGLTSTTATIW